MVATTPTEFAHIAQKTGKEAGFEVEVWDKSQIAEKGFGALLGVNQGSERPPAFILMEYKPEAPVAKVALAGKGVTFDTGGISIKPSTNMHFMKSDMGGAAAVLGTMAAVARRQLPEVFTEDGAQFGWGTVVFGHDLLTLVYRLTGLSNLTLISNKSDAYPRQSALRTTQNPVVSLISIHSIVGAKGCRNLNKGNLRQ